MNARAPDVRAGGAVAGGGPGGGARPAPGAARGARKSWPETAAGEALVELLTDLEAAGRVPPLATLGALLAGDLYSDPAASRRGATGDVRDVWRAFARCFRWVAGVAGNHDRFGAGSRDRERFAREPGIHLLDGEVIDLDGLRVGGVSGIIGPPEKPDRRDEQTMLALLDQVVAASPEVIVLHEGPDRGRGYPGNAAIGRALAAGHVPLVVCGHVHWPEAVGPGPGGGQVLNVKASLDRAQSRPRPPRSFEGVAKDPCTRTCRRPSSCVSGGLGISCY